CILAFWQKSAGRYRSLPFVFLYRTGDCVVLESNTAAATRARLRICGIVLCFCDLDWFRRVGVERISVQENKYTGRGYCGVSCRTIGRTGAVGFPELG